MEHVFVTLQHLLKDTTVTTFIKHFDDRRIYQYDEFFLLDQDRINRLFKSNLEELASDITLTPEDIDLETTKVVAMTIDGDFVLGSDSQVVVVPNTMVKADVETFDMPVIDFFVNYEEQTLQSAIIPTYTTSDASEEEISETIGSSQEQVEEEIKQEPVDATRSTEEQTTESVDSTKHATPAPKSKPSLLAKLFGRK